MTDHTEGVWYFAHPYTVKGADGRYIPEGEDAQFRICCFRAAELMMRGFNIYAPICHTHPIHRACPEFLQRHEHKMWYRLDTAFIGTGCFRGIILAPGWEDSTGCVQEKKDFDEAGKRVLFYEDIMQETKAVPSDAAWDAQRAQETKRSGSRAPTSEPQAELPLADEPQHLWDTQPVCQNVDTSQQVPTECEKDSQPADERGTECRQ